MISTGPWDILLKTGADALLEQLRARIRARDDQRAHDHVKDESKFQAELKEMGAEADFARAWRMQEHAAGVRVWEQVTLHEVKLRQEASPFKLPPSDIRAVGTAATKNGDSPALIIAPFVDRVGSPGGSDVARQLWWRAQQRADWTVGLAGLSGHMRPVHDFDIDIDLIRQVLGEIPFVLVHGDAEVDRIQVRIVGSGVLPQPQMERLSSASSGPGPAVSISGTLPWLENPGSYRLADDMLDTLLACVGVLGEIFHLARSGRQPQLHNLVPDWLKPGVTSMIIGGYGIAVQNGAWNSEVVSGLQDLVVSMPVDDEDGLRSRARNLLADVMRRLASSALSESG